MKYLDTSKHWSTYFLALWVELVTTRAEMVFCLHRNDYGLLGNLMIFAWWVLVVSVLRYFYQPGKRVRQ